jgi:hypothetical protein
MRLKATLLLIRGFLNQRRDGGNNGDKKRRKECIEAGSGVGVAVVEAGAVGIVRIIRKQFANSTSFTAPIGNSAELAVG